MARQKWSGQCSDVRRDVWRCQGCSTKRWRCPSNCGAETSAMICWVFSYIHVSNCGDDHTIQLWRRQPICQHFVKPTSDQNWLFAFCVKGLQQQQQQGKVTSTFDQIQIQQQQQQHCNSMLGPAAGLKKHNESSGEVA